MQLGLPVEPSARGVHVPSEPDMLQASQEPAHVVLQQRPSLQLPLTHWFPAVHVWPSVLSVTQLVPLHQ